jgi:hypothetical protein
MCGIVGSSNALWALSEESERENVCERERERESKRKERKQMMIIIAVKLWRVK